MDDIEDEGDVHQYKVAFESLTSGALDPEQSRALITAVADQVWHNPA
jgi:hypothetical protein